MRTNQIALILSFTLILGGCATREESQAPPLLVPQLQKLWENFDGMSVPESVLYDTERGYIYVANINGMPSEKNGLGYISRLDKDGKLLDSAWVSGLNAPKGMDIHKGDLYVSDIDRLVRIDLQNGSIVSSYANPNAKFLNDVTIKDDGKVFVSDMRGSTIYSLVDDSLTTWLADTAMLVYVNGLNCSGDTLFAGVYDHIFAFTADTVRLPMALSNSTGGIDGLERLEQGWIWSDWTGHVTYEKDTLRIPLLDTTPDTINAADIDVVQEEMLLLVPTFFHNSVAAYRIEYVEHTK